MRITATGLFSASDLEYVQLLIIMTVRRVRITGMSKTMTSQPSENAASLVPWSTTRDVDVGLKLSLLRSWEWVGGVLKMKR